MKDFKIAAKRIGIHGMILLKGFVKVLYGASVADLIAIAVYGFMAIPSEGGYRAVCDFIGAIAIMAIALTGMYVMGGNKKGAKK